MCSLTFVAARVTELGGQILLTVPFEAQGGGNERERAHARQLGARFTSLERWLSLLRQWSPRLHVEVKRLGSLQQAFASMLYWRLLVGPSPQGASVSATEALAGSASSAGSDEEEALWALQDFVGLLAPTLLPRAASAVLIGRIITRAQRTPSTTRAPPAPWR